MVLSFGSPSFNYPHDDYFLRRITLSISQSRATKPTSRPKATEVVAGAEVEAAEVATTTSVSPIGPLPYINELSGFIWLRYFLQLATVGPAVKSTTLPSTPNKEAVVTLAEVAEAAATSVSPPVAHPTYKCAL